MTKRVLLGKRGNSVRHASFKYPLPLENTDLLVILDNQPGTEGLVIWTIKLKPPKLYDYTLPELSTGSVLDPE